MLPAQKLVFSNVQMVFSEQAVGSQIEEEPTAVCLARVLVCRLAGGSAADRWMIFVTFVGRAYPVSWVDENLRLADGLFLAVVKEVGQRGKQWKTCRKRVRGIVSDQGREEGWVTEDDYSFQIEKGVFSSLMIC